ncbi:cytochrome b559 subunit alpha [Candidatus Gracilibacteria bacterium]|jgi:photosystem II cytochrome b559 subunit alpha|nr:cytochrome b559 subunit alpha [Candidatus Gracilibacteria bacterium]NJM87895.1 cytochrome b559 subunit alpha [Hydrococcus sp. RU_2_2]NJP18548.1 cytochrome b559 subunit alpha [Hydrococcus sp. CRU_1_1]
MAGSTGERPLADIVTDTLFWRLHIVNFPAVFLSGWLFVSTGLAYDTFGTPRPDQYYAPDQEGAPIVTERFQVKQQLDRYFQQQSAPSIK